MNARNYDEYVLQILKQGSLTRAAAALGISQPALSSGLTNLEAEMGFKVFNRKTVPVSLTPEGALYVDYIHRLGTLSADFNRRLEDCRRDAGNSVTIGGSIAYIETLVSDAVIRLLERHPRYKVALKAAPLGELIDMARRGDINCFITASDRLPDTFHCEFVKRERVYLCVPRACEVNDRLAEYRTVPGAGGRPFDYRILDGSRFICMEQGQPLQNRLERFAEAYGLKLENGVRVNQVSTAVAFAAKGWGLCFASEDALGGVDPDRLCVYALPEDISDRGIYVAYDRELYRSRACEDLIALLKQREAPGETTD